MNRKELNKDGCPKCGKRGLHYPMHSHAYGFKDYSRVRCRFCKSVFWAWVIRETPKKEGVVNE